MLLFKGKIQAFDYSKGPIRCSDTVCITSMRGNKISFRFVGPLRGCDVFRDVTKPFFLNLYHDFRMIFCLLTHQTCKEGRFSQPLWFCDWYTKTCCQHYLLRQSYTQPGSLFVQNPPKTSRKWAGVPDTGMLEFSVSERCEVFCWGEMFYLIINQTSWNVYTVMAFQ